MLKKYNLSNIKYLSLSKVLKKTQYQNVFDVKITSMDFLVLIKLNFQIKHFYFQTSTSRGIKEQMTLQISLLFIHIKRFAIKIELSINYQI